MKTYLEASVEPRNIIVAVDGSENALRAVHFGAMLAKKFGSRLILLHVVQYQGYFTGPVPTMSKTVDSILESYRTKAREKAQEWISKLASDLALKDVRIETQILDDQDTSVVGAIIEYASQNGVDLIAVGNRGLGGFKRMILGSVSQGIVTHANCNVVVVR